MAESQEPRSLLLKSPAAGQWLNESQGAFLRPPGVSTIKSKGPSKLVKKGGRLLRAKGCVYPDSAMHVVNLPHGFRLILRLALTSGVFP